MKNVLSFLFVAGMISLAACGGKKEEATDAAATLDSAVVAVDSAVATMDSAASAVVDSVAK